MSDNAIILIDPVAALAAATARRDVVARMRQTSILQPGVDYGVIPGSLKPTLLKPGAERLCAALGFNPRFELVDKVERWDPEAPLFHYQYRCTLVHIETGAEVATGIGSCNSMEAKYRWRQADRHCPVCGQATIIKGKQEYGGGWICFAKKGGCGAKFAAGDPVIEGQVTGRVPNDDVFSLVNTIDKIAQKRALIGATLIGANASADFTQDIEDLPGFGGDIVEGQIVDDPAVSSSAPSAGVKGAGVGPSKTSKPSKPAPAFAAQDAWQAWKDAMTAKYGAFPSVDEAPAVLQAGHWRQVSGPLEEVERRLRAWAIGRKELAEAALRDALDADEQDESERAALDDIPRDEGSIFDYDYVHPQPDRVHSPKH